MRKTSEMTGMVHLNGNLLCVIDIEATNPNPEIAEIVEIAVLPVDMTLNISNVVLPFHIKMRPENLDAIDYIAMSINRQQVDELRRSGVSQDEGMDLFCRWHEELHLPFKKKIMPLGHNYLGYDKLVISNWLGKELYDLLIHFHARDSMVCALYMNDRAFFQGVGFPFQRVGLSSICAQWKVSRGIAHNAMDDCVATLEVYKRMMGTATGLLPEFDTEAPPD